MKYFDTTYIVRLYTEDPGWNNVRSLAARDRIECSILGKAETVAAFHRKFREGQFNKQALFVLIEEFEQDSEGGAISWLPLSSRILMRVAQVYKKLSAAKALRAADAIHLATAAEKGALEIYSNDRRLLMSASDFGLDGINVI